jgi:SAM-dependent methyltransferase
MIFSISRLNTDAIAAYGRCCSKGFRVACLMQASELDEISRSIHLTLRSLGLISAQPCWRGQTAGAFRSALMLIYVRWTLRASHSPTSLSMRAVATFLFCVLPEDLQVPALRELGRVVKPGGIIRLLEYVRPRGAVRQAIARLWEPWMAWAYGAGFDRRTEEHVPEADLEVIESRFVVDDLMKLIAIRVPK